MITKKETALKAIKSGKPKLAQWSPELLKDDDLVIEGMKADTAFCNEENAVHHSFFDHISDKAKIAAVELNDVYFPILPKSALTDEYCVEKLRKNGTLLQWLIRSHIKLTEEMYEAAIESGRYYVRDLLENMLTENIVLKSLEEDNGLRWIPEKWRTPKVILKSLDTEDERTFRDNLLFIPSEQLVQALKTAWM